LRPDLIPQQYCDEFKKLQDNVGPLDPAIIKEVIEQELQQPLSTIFKRFDDAPLASASIGQVHKAVLRDGSVVVVKVQRPHVRETMHCDIDIMEYIARKVDKTRYGAVHASEIVAEFKSYTDRELDLTFEMRTLKRAYEFFKESKTVLIPKVHEQYCTAKILVMEYVDGVPLTDRERLLKEKYSLKQLARICWDGLLHQAFDLGMFHADPHPGNLIALRRGRQQMLAFIDFGITGFINEDLQESTFKFLTALADYDAHAVTAVILRISQQKPGFDPRQFENVVATRLMEWRGTTVAQERISMLFTYILHDAIDAGIRMPANVVLLGKALLTIEGTGLWLNPQINFEEEIGPILAQLAARRYSPAVIKRRIGRKVRELDEFISDLPQLVQALTETVKSGRIDVHVDAHELVEAVSVYDLEMSRKTISYLLGAIVIAVALLAAFSPQAMLFGIPLYIIGMSCALIIIICYVHVRRRIHKYLRLGT
jgi:ubiquinone biosynthesis protein